MLPTMDDNERTGGRRLVKYSARMVEALGFEPDDELIAGNVMANAIRTAYATSSDPFAGINFGWTDEDEQALRFVLELVDAIEERADELDDPTATLANEDWHEAADAAVPIYTGARWACAARFRDLFDEDEAAEFAAGWPNLAELLGVNLYVMASTILGALARAWDDAEPEES